MQGSRICLLVGGIVLAASTSIAQADTLQPDPAWQQGKLNNGFHWQILSTPQRPSDRIELRLIVNTGSLVENIRQTGYTHLLSRMALTHNAALDPIQQRELWQQGMNPNQALAPAITSYEFTQYNLSLPNNRPDLLKDALSWLAATAGKMDISEEVVNSALGADDPIATWPANPMSPWWRYRTKGSALLGHDPAAHVTMPVDIDQLKHFYQQWYTPDAMTLFVVGNVEGRSLSEQIGKYFSSLTGRRQTPAPIPTLPPLSLQPVNLVNNSLSQDRLALIWDSAWLPIQGEQSMRHYWLSDLAREALFWHVQRVLSENKTQGVQIGFDCRVLYQRAQCAINMDSDAATLNKNLELIARELANVRDNGLPQSEFDALIAQKNAELNKLFATYARIDTSVLMGQRLRSQQNAVVDIAPEQYQKLRRRFLSDLKLPMMNQELRQQLSQELTLMLMQPQGEPEANMRELQSNWTKIMAPAASTIGSEDGKTEVLANPQSTQ
ncbi:Predicted Zn-dependent peptidase [Izhakiella capsodis]|uniref:Predicted Zn-dependent peptidase n=1 Tax=Izhakiella capsodis TaxID=1367852 RepID=A0A1I4ZNQ9_9GAMM|nr:pitrilysin family protein [Izhakiella capsodis]SFN51852.1 Predicted Zn-dependent peptidase [Izhakiella capsodis]